MNLPNSRSSWRITITMILKPLPLFLVFKLQPRILPSAHYEAGDKEDEQHHTSCYGHRHDGGLVRISDSQHILGKKRERNYCNVPRSVTRYFQRFQKLENGSSAPSCRPGSGCFSTTVWIIFFWSHYSKYIHQISRPGCA